MRKVGLLLNGAEAVIKFALARAIMDKYPVGEIPEQVRAEMQRPSLGKFLSVLRHCIQANDCGKQTGILSRTQREWRTNAGDDVCSWIVEIRNKKWGHAAILEEHEYEKLGCDLAEKIAELVKALAPLLQFTSKDSQCAGDAPDKELLKNESIEPLIIFEPNKERYYFFNSTSDKGIEYLCYSDGSERIEPRGSKNDLLFQKLFPRPKYVTERPAYWFEHHIRTKSEGYYNRVNPENQISKWLKRTGSSSLMVFGEPGFGKTSLLAQMTQVHHAVCYHFFDEKSGRSLDLAECFLNLTLQLKERLAMDFTPGGDSSIKARAEEFERQLLLACESNDQTLLIVIDALDDELRSHPVKDGRDPKSFLSYLPNLGLLGDKVRWLFSARTEIENHHWFQLKLGHGVAEVLTLNPFDKHEAENFLCAKCADIKDFRDILAAVVRLSEGSPLYLTLFIEEWHKIPCLFKDRTSIPKGVTGYYQHIVSSIKARAAEKAAGNNNALFGRLFQIAQKNGNQDVLSFLKVAKEGLKSAALFPDELILLALHSLAYEPLSVVQTSEIMEWPLERCMLAYAGVSSLVTKAAEGHSVHHNALRDLILREEPDSVSVARSRIAQWVGASNEKNPYAMRWGLTHLCDALSSSSQEERSDWERKITDVLTSLTQIEARAKIHLLPQLLRDYDRFFALCPEHGGPCPLPFYSPNGSGWLSECTSALVRGIDLHLDKGFGASLIALRASDELDRFQWARTTSNEQQGEPQLIERKGTDVLEYAEFVRSSAAAFSAETFNIGQLAENFCADGVVSEAGMIFKTQDTRIRLVNPPSRSQRRTLRSHDEPFQFISKDLREGWIWKLEGEQGDDLESEDDDHRASEGGTLMVRVSRHDTWTQKLIASFSIAIPSKPPWGSTLLISLDNETAILDNIVLNLKEQSVYCQLPFKKAEIVASDDLKIALALLPGSFNGKCVIIDVFAGRILGKAFSAQEIHSIAISFDGRLAAYGAYYGLTFIDIAKRKEIPISIPGYKVSGICFGGKSSLIAWSENIPNESGTLFRVANMADRQLLSQMTTGDYTVLVSYAETCDMALTHSGDLLNLGNGTAVDSTGHSTMKSARFEHLGMFYHTGYELREPGEGGDDHHQERWTSLKMLGKEHGCLATCNDGTVALYAYGSNKASFSYARDDQDVHFVSSWRDIDGRLKLEPGVITSVSCTRDCKSVLLGYDDGLLYIGNLVTGEMRRVNSPGQIQQLIDAKFRRFMERGLRTKIPDSVFRKRQGPRYSVSRACISGDGQYAATVCHGEKIRVWSVETGENISSLAIPFGKSLTEGEVDGMSFSSHENVLLILRADQCVMVWKFLHSRHARILRPPEKEGFSCSRRDLDEHDGLIAAYLGGWMTTWSIGGETAEPSSRLIPTYPWGARINLRTRKILCWDEEEGPSKISLLDFDSLNVLATHHLTSDSPSVSNLADDGSFVVGSKHRNLEFFEVDACSRGSADA